MCGFIQRVTDCPAVIDLLEEVGLTTTLPLFKEENGGVLNFYPAFGKNPARKITNLITAPDNVIDATWWFDARPEGDGLVIGDRTTFNARNLDSPFWKQAVRYQRGIVVATAVGESNPRGKGKVHYLMEAQGAMLIGAVYRQFDNGTAACAVITRPPHPRFSQFHEKSIPCFLPHNRDAVNAWLNGGPDDPVVSAILDEPKLYTGLTVSEVKTFKGGEKTGDSCFLAPSGEDIV